MENSPKLEHEVSFSNTIFCGIIGLALDICNETHILANNYEMRL